MNSSNDVIAFRLEWNNKGPFWDDKVFRLLKRLCRQATPSWKNEVEERLSTFLDYYLENAPSPYDNPILDSILSHVNFENNNYRFGFVSKEILEEQFGLDIEIYRTQFTSLFERSEFAIKAYIVKPIVTTNSEVLFRKCQAVLADTANSVSTYSCL